MRPSLEVLAAAGIVTAAQLGLATGASARAEAPQSTGCPVDIVFPSRFYVNSSSWVTDGGLYFAVKNKSASTSFKKVTFTVTDVKNIRFGSATAEGGKVTHRTSKTVSVYTTTLKKKTSLGVKVQTHLLNTRAYEVKFELHGSGWNCAVDQGTWGS
ncbi:hypothetical protein [Streptomyces sp. Ag109_O5-1]|uniref:hypothetical protein n=1 Tax=Streptomyces sp. Ag109_O5-1 TaxID=1938851 RepID=UPI0021A8E14D|nr:hypothetical protein [Streptomyces sp. Ag109_O5-1]